MTHDITQLPKWAQKQIVDLEDQIARLQGLKKAHAVLMDGTGEGWFTLPFHKSTFAEKDYRTLYILERDCPCSLCDIGKTDVVLIGRGERVQKCAL